METSFGAIFSIFFNGMVLNWSQKRSKKGSLAFPLCNYQTLALISQVTIGTTIRRHRTVRVRYETAQGRSLGNALRPIDMARLFITGA